MEEKEGKTKRWGKNNGRPRNTREFKGKVEGIGRERKQRKDRRESKKKRCRKKTRRGGRRRRQEDYGNGGKGGKCLGYIGWGER